MVDGMPPRSSWHAIPMLFEELRMSDDIIQAQYEQLAALARRFGKQADLQTALQKRVQTRVERLRNAGWAGRGSAAFYAEMDGKVFPAMQRLELALREAQKVTLQIGAIVRQAEAAAAEPFREADQQGVSDLQTATRQGPLPGPTPVPTPTPAYDAGEHAPPLPIANAVESLDDVLKPIDWVSNSKTASKAFDETLKEIGRILNAVTGERGHIKMMSELFAILSGVGKVVGGISKVLTLRDYNRYFAGELTNQQMAASAVKACVPIPILNDKIAAWMITNMPDPNGRWRGPVTPVE
jgi:WXG100 family type VII secretion target